MADLPTFDDLFSVARDEVVARNALVTREAVEREGTDANALVAASAAAGDEVVGVLARTEAALYSDSSKDVKLDRLLIDRLNLFRRPAAAGFVTLEWTSTAPAGAAFSIPVDTRVAAADGSLWVTLTAVTFPAGSTGPVRVAARSAAAGLNQQAKAGVLTNIVDMPTGAATGLAVTNPLASAGCDDAERDEEFLGRSRAYLATLARGTVPAVQAAAAAYPGVRSVAAFEAIDGDARPARVIQLVITDAFTDALVGEVTPPAYATQSQALAAAVAASDLMQEARAGGIQVLVTVAQVVIQVVHLSLTFSAGADADAAAYAARQRVVAYVNSLAPGQRFVRSDCAAALQTVAGLLVTGAEVLSPAGDVVPQTLQVLRTNLAAVAVVSALPEAAV